MRRSDLDRLRDALRHVQNALDLWAGMTPDALERDRVAYQSILFDLIIIGTTFAEVPTSVRNVADAIPWRAIIRTRNRLVHAYWNNSVEFVVGLLDRDLPNLLPQLSKLIDHLEQDES